MLFSYPAIFILLIFILLAMLLLAPFNLSLNAGKKGPLIWGSIKLAWLGLTIRKLEISPQAADELLATIRKDDDGKEERDIEEIKLAEKSEVREKVIESETEGETKDTIRPPSIQSLIDVAPALLKIFCDILKSIHFKKSYCRLCFGLHDPAQTAIISGYLWFFASALGISLSNISIKPWFDGVRLEGQLRAEIEARPICPVFAVIKAVRIREIRQLLKGMLGWT